MKRTHRILFLLFAASFLLAIGLGAAKAEPPPCIPGLKGQVAPHQTKYISGGSGFHVFYWCQLAAGRVQDYGFSCGKFGGCELAAAKLWLSLRFNPNSDPDTIWNENITWACDPTKAKENSSDGRLCAERLTILAMNKTAWLSLTPTLAPAVWRVEPYGTATTRPVRALTNGVLASSDHPTLRAPVGAVCIMTKPTDPATFRAQWEGGPDGFVTVCTRGAP